MRSVAKAALERVLRKAGAVLVRGDADKLAAALDAELGYQRNQAATHERDQCAAMLENKAGLYRSTTDPKEIAVRRALLAARDSVLKRGKP